MITVQLKKLRVAGQWMGKARQALFQRGIMSILHEDLR
jgi:hypothetical protein